MSYLSFVKYFIFVGAFVFAFGFTKYLVNAAHGLNLIDKPNARSSHNVPTPRGGGLAFVLAFFIGLFAFWLLGIVDTQTALPVLVGGLPVAIIGFIDDVRSLPAQLRLVFQLVAAGVVCWQLTDGFSQSFDLSFLGTMSIWVEVVIVILGLVWLINLYNFMDGIDGLAATQAVVVSALSALICYWQQSRFLLPVYSLLGFSVLGFLLLNWSPARIFMGDCGAYFLGFAFASMALVGRIHGGQSLVPHLILLGIFICDATYTLTLRAMQKKRPYQAHRDHGYQHLAAKGNSHSRAAAILNGITVFWLGPMAILSLNFPDWEMAILILSYVPILGLMISLQAGIEWKNQKPKAAPSVLPA